MKKFLVLFISALLIIISTTACNFQSKTQKNMIQSKRRFAQYVEPQQNSAGKTVDLSEGPKLRYNANLGPQSLNFDFKIVDPYQFK